MALLDASGRPFENTGKNSVSRGDLKLLGAWPELAPGGWTVESIRRAIDDYERGWIAPASRLARALGRSARYVQAKRQAIDTVLGLPLEVVPAGNGRGMARVFAEGARVMLSGILTAGVESWMLERGEVMNLGLAQIEWDTTVTPWTPVALHEWPLSATRYDHYNRKLYAQVEGAQEVEIRPGDGRWVCYDPEGWLRWEGMIRCLGEPWCALALGNRNLNNRAARSSIAVIDAEVPTGTFMEDKVVTDFKAQLKAVQTGLQAGILRPAGWATPTVLDLSGRDPSGLFSLTLDTAATDMIVAWLGQDGTAKNEGGSLAKTQVLNGVAYDLVERRAGKFYGRMNPDGSREPGTITRQIVRPWVLFQPGGSDELVPLVRRIVPDLEEDERLAEESARATRFYQEVTMAEAMAGRPLTSDELRALAKLRGVRVPATILERPENFTPPAPVAPLVP